MRLAPRLPEPRSHVALLVRIILTQTVGLSTGLKFAYPPAFVRTSTSISVIIVTFRSREVLEGCLTSLQTTSVPGLSLEVLLVDNASADGTPRWIRANYPDVQVIENPVNVGFARACNQALALASGEYVLFLNPDARLIPGALEAMIQRLRQELRPGLLSPRLQGGGPPAWGRFPTLGRLAARRLGARPEPEPGDGPVDWVLGACMLGPTEVVRELGGFDEDYFLYGEDVDLCDRMAAAGRTVVYYPLVTVTHLGNDRWDPDRLARVHGAVLLFFKKRRSLVSYLAVWIGLRLLKLWRGGGKN